EPCEARFIAVQAMEPRFVDLRFGAGDFPDAYFIDRAFEFGGRIVRGHGLAEVETFGVFQTREAARVLVGRREPAVQVELHPAFAGNSGDMAPLPNAQEVRNADRVKLS